MSEDKPARYREKGAQVTRQDAISVQVIGDHYAGWLVYATEKIKEQPLDPDELLAMVQTGDFFSIRGTHTIERLAAQKALDAIRRKTSTLGAHNLRLLKARIKAEIRRTRRQLLESHAIQPVKVQSAEVPSTMFQISSKNATGAVERAPTTTIMPTASKFDVFLSHYSKNKPAVRDLKERLVAHGLTVWFDTDELRPGIPWQRLLEDGIKSSASVAVIVGQDGLGPWEDEEMQAALVLAVKDKRPVIPVLLPGAPAQPELPMFLGNRTWVDLRAGFTDEGVGKLVWGITGRKPNPK